MNPAVWSATCSYAELVYLECFRCTLCVEKDRLWHTGYLSNTHFMWDCLQKGTARCENDAIPRDCPLISCFTFPFASFSFGVFFLVFRAFVQFESFFALLYCPFLSFSFFTFFHVLCYSIRSCLLVVVLMKLRKSEVSQPASFAKHILDHHQQQQQQSRPGCIVCHWTSGLLNLRVTCDKFTKWMFLFANKKLTALILKKWMFSSTWSSEHWFFARPFQSLKH